MIALAAAVAIPLSSPEGWQNLTFKKIKANQVEFGAKGLSVTVASSSSPLIFPLKTPLYATGFSADIEIEGELKNPTGKMPEDAYLRLGLVAPGQRRMSMMEKMVAPEWLKRLFSLAPAGGGVDKVYFFNLVDHGTGQSREFPGSKGLMTESLIQGRKADENKLTFAHTLAKPIPAIALWLSIDGDDSQSSYSLVIKSLKISGEPLTQPRLEKSE